MWGWTMYTDFDLGIPIHFQLPEGVALISCASCNEVSFLRVRKSWVST